MSGANTTSSGASVVRLLRLNASIQGLTTGVLAALGVFLATNWLVIKGGEVVRLGVIKKNNVSPRVANCHLNWLLQYLDRKTDYQPLVSEFSYQIRTGMAERRKCLILFVLSNFLVKSGIYRNYIRRREINFALEFLDLKIKDIIKKLSSTLRKIDLK